MKIVKLPQALTDLIETADYLVQDDPRLADQLFDAFETTIETIGRTPKIGSLRRSNDGTEIRMWFIAGFEKCLIFYTENSEEIVLLRVIHASRDYTRFFDQS
jgi:plasmid stabilization system protein ParE